jgi:hypothetical protein
VSGRAEALTCVSGLIAAKRTPVRGRLAPVLVLGFAAWSIALVFPPAPLPARIMLLAPLVIVPRLVRLLPTRPPLDRVEPTVILAAALPLLVAFALPAGPVAAVFAVPWLVAGVVAGASGVIHGLSRRRSAFPLPSVPDLGIDVALGFWTVAAVFVVVDRLGVATPFPPVIVLLTATHFHVAGVGLLTVAARLAEVRPWLRMPVVGLVGGIPVTALGFVVASPVVGAAGALLVGSAGIGVATGLLTGAAPGLSRWPGGLAGGCLLVGMPMGIAWSLAILANVVFVDIDVMIRTHGVLNALAVTIAVVAWRRDVG